MGKSVFFRLIDDPEIADEAYGFVFSLCDRVRYLGCYRMERDIAEELLASPYADVLPSLVSLERDSEWGMEGTYASFSLSEPVKRMVKENSLGGIVPVCTVKEKSGEEHVVLENLSLWKGEERLYAVCSHEGYTDAKKEFTEQVASFCLGRIGSAKRYLAMKERYERLKDRPLGELQEEYLILQSLPDYVSEAIGDWMYFAPSRECDFRRFLSIAEGMLTPDVAAELKEAGSFAKLHPPGAADFGLLRRDIESGNKLLTQEERERIVNHPRFRESALAQRVCDELEMLQTVFFREAGIGLGEGEGKAPTFVIRQ